MKKENPYEYLKTPCLEDVEPVDAQAAWTITESADETVTIYTSLLERGSWVYGYLVRWHNGRTSVQKPVAELGLFASQREAKLYAVAFMLMYAEHFTAETRSLLYKAETSCQQSSLF